MKIKPKYLHLTEESNALDYFEKAVFFIEEASASDIAWKWVVLSLHGALYGFAISACRGTDSNSVIIQSKKNSKSAKGQLISFDEALRRCCAKSGYVNNPLVLSPEQKESIRWLKQVLRNNFEHYAPCHWSIELHGFPMMALNCIRVIEALATETSMWVHLNNGDRSLLKELVVKAKGKLLNSPLYLEHINACGTH